MALDRFLQLGERQTHVLEILDITTAAFEFIGRMADRRIFSGSAAISFEFQDVEGRQADLAARCYLFIGRHGRQCLVPGRVIHNRQAFCVK
jgi:hypothetical protein